MSKKKNKTTKPTTTEPERLSPQEFLDKHVLQKNQDVHMLGLYDRYLVSKRDGSVSQGAVYFVLRLDTNGNDKAWSKCCRKAIVKLVKELNKRDHLPKLAIDLLHKIQELEDAE